MISEGALRFPRDELCRRTPDPPIADPLIGLGITAVILRITWVSWATVRGHEHHH
jgi:hypothetical protein